MDHHDRDLARLVRADQHQPRAIHVLLGAEQARPAILRQIALRPHVGQRRCKVRLHRQLGIEPDLRLADRVDKLQRTFARVVDRRVAELRHWAKERREREAHLARVELLGAGCRAVALADRDQGHADAVLIGLGRQAADLIIRAEDELIDVLGLPGSLGRVEEDAEDLLAAVDLADELAVRLKPARLRIRERRADQVVEAAVVEAPRELEPRVGLLTAVGELGGEEVLVGVGDRVDVAVERLAAAAVVEPPGLEPRELGQRVDEVAIDCSTCLALQAGDHAGDVAAVARFEVVAAERLVRALGRTVERREVLVERRVRPVRSRGGDRDVGVGEQGEDDRPVREHHARVTPSTPSGGSAPSARSAEMVSVGRWSW